MSTWRASSEPLAKQCLDHGARPLAHRRGLDQEIAPNGTIAPLVVPTMRVDNLAIGPMGRTRRWKIVMRLKLVGQGQPLPSDSRSHPSAARRRARSATAG